MPSTEWHRNESVLSWFSNKLWNTFSFDSLARTIHLVITSDASDNCVRLPLVIGWKVHYAERLRHARDVEVDPNRTEQREWRRWWHFFVLPTREKNPNERRKKTRSKLNLLFIAFLGDRTQKMSAGKNRIMKNVKRAETTIRSDRKKQNLLRIIVCEVKIPNVIAALEHTLFAC